MSIGPCLVSGSEESALGWPSQCADQELQRHARRLGFPEENEFYASPRKVLYQNAYSYFPNNKDAIRYPAFRAMGWPIGSGVAEGAVKQFALRLKGSEKFWNLSHTGAEQMLTLCLCYFAVVLC